MTALLLSPTSLATLTSTAAPSAANSSASTMSPAETQMRAKIASTSKEFESQFLSVMMGEMMKGVGEKGAFGGGGEGETAFKSFMTDAFGKAISARGGIGLAKAISKSMLHLQGLS